MASAIIPPSRSNLVLHLAVCCCVIKKLDFLLFFVKISFTQIAQGEMNLSEEAQTNATSLSRGLTLESFRDPDAFVSVGFWLNGVGMLIIGVMGIFGNIASIRVLSHKQMRSSANFILIALASSDLILIITSMLLFGFTAFYPYNGGLKDYFFIIAPLLTKITFPLANIGELMNLLRDVCL